MSAKVMTRKQLRKAVELSTLMLFQMPSATELNSTLLSASLKPSIVLKFFKDPVAATEFCGTLRHWVRPKKFRSAARATHPQNQQSAPVE